MNPKETNRKEMRREDMKCEEAAEFVSALCDGKRIPPDAAEHIRTCGPCRNRLQEYAEMETDLLLLASLETTEEPETSIPRWEKTQRVGPNWWQKGWETMRIPRFAFALLVVAVVALGSSLTMMKVRAHEQGKVLALTAKTASGRTIRCAFDIEGKASGRYDDEEIVDGAVELYGFRFISRDGDRIQLGVRAKHGAHIAPNTDATEKLPETAYWFQPGQELEINVEGSGTMVITGELLDYMPTFLAAGGAQLNPKPGELRFADPLLLRGNKVLHDFEGFTITGTGKDEGIQLCVPHDGPYEFSFSQMEGASEGKIEGSRISFKLNGQPYKLLAGAPVARAERIWVLHPANEKDDNCNNGFGSMSQYLAKTPPKN